MYAVEITKNGCLDTFDCYTVNILGIVNTSTLSDVRVYPSPSSGIVFIDLGEIKRAIIRVYDIKGKVVIRKEIENNGVVELEILQTGSYILTVASENEKKKFNIIIQ